jgi:hypothetical protein
MKTTNNDEPLDAKLSKLQERERKLRTEALQLRARAEHLNRVQLTHAKRLARKIDAHEKIVLGALVKKAGLDKYVLPGMVASANQENNNVMTPYRLPMIDLASSYDCQFVVGALLWLASVLHQTPGEVLRVPNHDGLRDAGRMALADDPRLGR